jgi:hypothetical protein
MMTSGGGAASAAPNIPMLRVLGGTAQLTVDKRPMLHLQIGSVGEHRHAGVDAGGFAAEGGSRVETSGIDGGNQRPGHEVAVEKSPHCNGQTRGR